MQFTTLVLQIMNLNHLAIAVALAASTSTIACDIFHREQDGDELHAANKKKIVPLFGSTAAFAPAQTSKASTALNANFIEGTKALPFGSSLDTLGGSLPGDFGFDPIGLATFASFNNPLYMEGDFVSNLEWLREAELAHGRMAQLAVIRFILPGLFGTFPGSDEFGSVDAYSELNPLKAIATVPESVLHQIVAGMEWFEYQRVIRIKEKDRVLGDIGTGYPGG
jgi:light-harvesting complex I chlorophyll a/b binding protein 1